MLSVISECVKIVSIVFQRSLKGVSREFQGCFRGDSRLYRGCFRDFFEVFSMVVLGVVSGGVPRAVYSA